jgi:ParB family transcriptional regulator, chromosome partitioning protein
MRKIALGRGLEALIPTASDEAPEVGQFRSVPLDKISPNPHQPRKAFDPEKLAELAESFKSRGMLQPILITTEGSGYQLVAGERRYRAAKLANLVEVPALVLDDLDPTEMLQLALIENLQRENLNPIETAQAYQSLLDQCGLTQVELAERVGKNRASVANTLRLLGLPDHIKGLIADGKLSEGHARAILAVADPALRDRIAQRIMSETLSVRQAEEMTRKEKRRKLKVRRKSPGLEDAESFLKQTLGTAVRIVPGLKKSRIEVEYYGDDDLNRLLDMFRKLA